MSKNNVQEGNNKKIKNIRSKILIDKLFQPTIQYHN